MDYLKTVVPSQLMAERGSNLVVINPGSANVRMGFASQDVPFNIPHCIARRINPQEGEEPKFSLRDQMLNCRATSSQNAERESAYDIIAALMKIPFLDEEMPSLNQPLPPKMGRVDGFSSQQSRDDSKFTWTNVTERSVKPSTSIDRSLHKDSEEGTPQSTSGHDDGRDVEENKYKEMIFGEDALKIPPSESYCLSRPIRRGHFNVSHNYSLHQVLEDLHTIWNWMLTEKLHINPRDRGLYSAILVLGETFDNREIKDMLSIVLHDLGFSTAVVHQEALAAAFGNGLSTACVVNIGAQVTQVVCVEDGVALPHTALALPYGGDDISRCLLWVQRRHRTWPNFQTDPVSKPIDMLMLNKIKESYSQIRSGNFDAVALVHSYDNDRSVGHQKTRLSALNVPSMGLLYPRVLVPEEYPPPPRSWFQDYDDMLEDTWQTSDSLYPGGNGGYGMWDSYPAFSTRLKKFDNIGLVEAIVSSVLSTGRVDLQRKLFCSIQLVGGAASTAGLAPVLEQRILNKIPANQSVERVEVLQSRTYPLFVPWKGGVVRTSNLLPWTAASSSDNSAPAPYNTGPMPPSSSAEQVRAWNLLPWTAANSSGNSVGIPNVSANSTEHVQVMVGEEEVYYEYEDVVCSQPVQPCVGMEYDTIEEAQRVYNDYAFKMGFSIRVASSRISGKRDSKELIRKEWECSHARKPTQGAAADTEEETNSRASTNDTTKAEGTKKRAATAVLTTSARKRNTIKKFDCKAHMAVGKRDGKWRVIVMQPEHSHPLVKGVGVRKHLRSHRSISWADYELLKTLHHRNISTMQIMGILGDFHGGIANLTFSSKDVSNMRTRLRGGLSYRDMDATLEYFQKQQAESPSFYYAPMIDADNAVRGLFWVDGRTRELYKSFGDCIFLDTTFCTNRYSMPFAPIVGINNHLQSILLGCALLPDETTETFIWMLERLKEAMGGREPTNIMTDQDKAMKAAIAIVFPKAVHRCCKWHVLSKATEKFAWLISHEKDFATEFDYCVNRTETPEEYEGLWAMLGEKYKLQDNEFFQSISATRSMWAPAYFRKYFFPFTGTTGRSESMNSLFKKVIHPQDLVLQFVTQYDYIMDTRAERENKERCKGEISDPPLWGRYSFEKQAAQFYTGEVFGKFQELLRDSTRFKIGGVTADDQGWSFQVVHPTSIRLRTVSADKHATKYTCSCNMFDRDGLLCPHILKVFTNRDVDAIPERYLLQRWSKEATTKVPERLSGLEPAFGVPTTNKLRYNALCRKMTSLAAEACLGPEKYTIVSAGIDQLFETVWATRDSSANQHDEVRVGVAVNVAANQKPIAKVKNPPRTNNKGRPKEKWIGSSL